MDGFQPYLAVSGTLRRLNPKSPILNYSQKGAGPRPSISIVSPTAQVIAQAKEKLKRNKTEESDFNSTPKKPKKSPSKKSEVKKPVNKSQKVHKRYGNKNK